VGETVGPGIASAAGAVVAGGVGAAAGATVVAVGAGTVTGGATVLTIGAVVVGSVGVGVGGGGALVTGAGVLDGTSVVDETFDGAAVPNVVAVDVETNVPTVFSEGRLSSDRVAY
jgi:hypothetical protein